MVSYCSNPKCAKPLHYLREGKIYVFDVPQSDSSTSGDGHISHRMEHFWLCGFCSRTLVMQQTSDREIRLAAKTPAQMLAS